MFQKFVKIQKVLVESMEDLLKVIKELLTTILENNISQWLQQAWDTIKEYYDIISSWTWNDFWGYLDGSFDKLVNAVQGLFAYLQDFLQSVNWESIIDGAKDVIGDIINVILSLLAQVVGIPIGS